MVLKTLKTIQSSYNYHDLNLYWGFQIDLYPIMLYILKVYDSVKTFVQNKYNYFNLCRSIDYNRIDLY